MIDLLIASACAGAAVAAGFCGFLIERQERQHAAYTAMLDRSLDDASRTAARATKQAQDASATASALRSEAAAYGRRLAVSHDTIAELTRQIDTAERRLERFARVRGEGGRFRKIA